MSPRSRGDPKLYIFTDIQWVQCDMMQICYTFMENPKISLRDDSETHGFKENAENLKTLNTWRDVSWKQRGHQAVYFHRDSMRSMRHDASMSCFHKKSTDLAEIWFRNTMSWFSQRIQKIQRFQTSGEMSPGARGGPKQCDFVKLQWAQRELMQICCVFHNILRVHKESSESRDQRTMRFWFSTCLQ